MNSKKLAVLSALALTLTLGLMMFGGRRALAAGPWYVSTTGNDTNTCLSPGAACLTIQAAINKASGGDTINVAAGTYTEQIVIDRNLTLIGAGAGSTTIQAPAVPVNDPDGAKTLVLFTGPITAEFSGFTVKGPVDGLNFGIYVRDGATANIHDNVIKDIRDVIISGGQNGYAICVGKFNNTFPNVDQIGHATITNNTVYGYQKTGIECEGASSSATITGNTVTGAGPITFNSQNGIQIRRGATGSIINNTVTGNAYDGPIYSALGIGATYPGNGVIIQGNIVNHNTANIYTYQAYGVQILNNQVRDSAVGLTSAGIVSDSDDPATATTGIYGVTISGNTIQNNFSGGTHTGKGILLWGIKNSIISNNSIQGSGDDGIAIEASGNIAITGNQFSGNGFLVLDPNAAAIDFGGVYPNPCCPGLEPNPMGGFSVHNNSFVGNRYGVWNYDINSVNATCNWWGAADGPGPVGPGHGDRVSTNVTYQPWQIAPGGACIGGNVVTNKDQCKNNGWKTLVRANGTPFKNQGACIEYVEDQKDKDKKDNDDKKDKGDKDHKDGH